MKIIELQCTDIPEYDWWFHYLACHASTPRNWFECMLEPPHKEESGGLQVIDIYPTPEQGYPRGIYRWMVMCLDGAPERVRHLVNCCHFSPYVALAEVKSEEQEFMHLLETCILKAKDNQLQPTLKVVCHGMRDGWILGFETNEHAATFAKYVESVCLRRNASKQSDWIHQFHVRAGIGETLRSAFANLLHARRDEVACTTYEPVRTGTPRLRRFQIQSLFETRNL